jgi:hypothetical protein
MNGGNKTEMLDYCNTWKQSYVNQHAATMQFVCTDL